MKEKNGKTAVILLGSGFAIPFGGPSSGELLQRIKEHSYTNNSDVLKSRLISELLIALRNYYRPNPVNFETLIASLESLCQYNVSSLQNNWSVDYASILPAIYLQKCFTTLMEDEADSVGKSVPEYLLSVYKHCMCLILNRIYRYDNSSTPQKVCSEKKNNFVQFVESLISKGYHIKFYTTNYDRIVPRILKDIRFDEGLTEAVTDGADKEFDWFSRIDNPSSNLWENDEVDFSDAKCESRDYNPLFFHNDLERFHKAPYTYFNLHGSRYLSFDYHRRRPFFNINGTDYFSSIGQNNLGGNPNESLSFAPIIVGYSKTQRAFSEPFNFGFNSFALDCNNCDKFFSFGFSYKDPHINSIINTYLRSDVKIECVVKDVLHETLITPWQLQYQRKTADENIVNCNSGKIIKHGIEEYLEDKLYEEYI